jgi:4-hydroxybenzoate polyprenyltransferase
MDEDKGSIGGLKNPPPVSRQLYYASIFLDVTGLILCLIIGWEMFLLMTVYICVSKAYSWKKIRLKKFGFTGWLVVMLFQGGYTYLLVNMAVTNDFSLLWFNKQNIECMIIASLLIGGYYPLTQIYQHEEDSDRGDFTISYLLGIKGTFIFTGIIFIIACISAFHYFTFFFQIKQFLIFMVFLLPVITYYTYWFREVIIDPVKADFSNAMRITFLSSTCLILCFSLLFYLNHF